MTLEIDTKTGDDLAVPTTEGRVWRAVAEQTLDHELGSPGYISRNHDLPVGLHDHRPAEQTTVKSEDSVLAEARIELSFPRVAQEEELVELRAAAAGPDAMSNDEVRLGPGEGDIRRGVDVGTKIRKGYAVSTEPVIERSVA
jgi:hypothetical protein